MKTGVRWNKSNVNYYCHHHRYYNYRAGLLERYTRRMRITYTKKEKRKKSKWRIIKKSCILIWYTLHTWNTLIDVWLSVWVLSKTLRIFFLITKEDVLIAARIRFSCLGEGLLVVGVYIDIRKKDAYLKYASIEQWNNLKIIQFEVSGKFLLSVKQNTFGLLTTWK